MKFMLIMATLFILIWLVMNTARRRGKLDDNANRAVVGLASSMRIFVYGLLIFAGVACVAVAYQTW